VSDSIHHRPRQLGFAVIRRRGLQPKLDIIAIARELAAISSGRFVSEFLFDRSELDIKTSEVEKRGSLKDACDGDR
jgi:hypothetical protein